MMHCSAARTHAAVPKSLMYVEQGRLIGLF